MRRHVEVQKMSERDNYHTYWRLHLPMLLNTMEKNGFAQQNINTNNTSAVGQIVKNAYEHVARVAWERGCAKSITLCMFWRKLQAII